MKWGGWIYIDNLFMGAYFLEVALKLKTWSWKFFVDKDLWAWNLLDFTIVSTGVFDSWLTPLIRLFKQEVLGQVSSLVYQVVGAAERQAHHGCVVALCNS